MNFRLSEISMNSKPRGASMIKIFHEEGQFQKPLYICISPILTIKILFNAFFKRCLLLFLLKFLEPIHQSVLPIVFVVVYRTGVNKSFSYLPMVHLKNDLKNKKTQHRCYSVVTWGEAKYLSKLLNKLLALNIFAKRPSTTLNYNLINYYSIS